MNALEIITENGVVTLRGPGPELCGEANYRGGITSRLPDFGRKPTVV